MSEQWKKRVAHVQQREEKKKIEIFLCSRSLCERAREQEVVIFLTVHKIRLVRELQLKLWKVLVLFVQTPRLENLR